VVVKPLKIFVVVSVGFAVVENVNKVDNTLVVANIALVADSAEVEVTGAAERLLRLSVDN
jgi:hypothetical protein